jgi:hypothetical protein
MRGQGHGTMAGTGQAPLTSPGYVCLQRAMLVNVLVGRKSGIFVSDRKPRSMPCAALEEMVVFVTNCPPAGTPKMRIAASFGVPVVTE